MGKKTVIGGGVAALLLAGTLGTDIVGKWEGISLDPYRDIVGVQTVCYGETRVKMRKYTLEECKAMLNKAVGGFQQKVLKCTPKLANYPTALAAATSLSYNIGSSAYCKSTVAKRFNEGNIRAGCEGFYVWRMAGGKVVQGLVNRRKDETKLCLSGLQ